MSSSGDNTGQVTLTDHYDWESWSRKFKFQAVAAHLWDHIDPDQRLPLLQKPQLPQIGRYERRAAASHPPAGRGRRNQPNDGRKTPDGDDSIPAPPTSAAELSDAGRIAFEIDLQYYTLQEKEFREQDTAVQNLKKWVIDTVASHHVEMACEASDTIAIWYDNLRRKMGSDKFRSRRMAREQYKEAVEPLTNIKGWENWLKNWERAMAVAEKNGVPATLSTFSWVTDFLEAVEPVAGVWCSSYGMIILGRIETEPVTFRDLANDFYRQMVSLVGYSKGKGSTVAKGPSYTGRDTPDQGASGNVQKHGVEIDNVARCKGRSRKRRFPEYRGLSCAACGQEHPLSACFYVFPEKAPRWFCTRAKILKEVEDKLATDTSLQERVQELKAKRAKRQEDIEGSNT